MARLPWKACGHPASNLLKCFPLAGAALAAGSCFSCNRDEAAAGSAAGAQDVSVDQPKQRWSGEQQALPAPHTPSQHAGAARGCQKWRSWEPRHEPAPGPGGSFCIPVCPLSLGWGRHRGHNPAQPYCSQYGPAAPSVHMLLPAGTRCRRGGRWKGQSTGRSTHLPLLPPFSGPYRAPSCSGPKIELIVPRDGRRFMGG